MGDRGYSRVSAANRVIHSRAGEWEWEPQPSSRTDEFLARTRFATLEEAQAAYDTSAKPGA